MKRRLTRLLFLTVLVVPSAAAQDATQQPPSVHELVPVRSIYSSSVTKMDSRGDTLWVGPVLNVTVDGGDNWFQAGSDSLRGARNRVFSIDVEGDVVVAGLGYTAQEAEGSVQAAGGFLVSTDGGETFVYRFPQLDSPSDTVETYGVSTLPALPVIVAPQSPPYDIDYDPVTGDIYVAGWASGIRRSSDLGRTWQRVVLPPDDFEEIDPETEYDFFVAPRRANSGSFNHMGFSVLVDSEGTLWAGTPAGVNRRLAGEERWQRFSATGSPLSLTGSWVIAIDEQDLDDQNIVWMATWNASEAGEAFRDGITATRDQGETFEQMIIGERVYDFAFRDETVYAAAESGLLISDDVGQTWRSVRDFYDPDQPDRIVRPDVEVYSVETTTDALWAGTSDGLFRSTDEGATWQLFRAEVPLHPEVPTDRIPDVETYAYPNPFSPAVDRYVRIRYENPGGASASIRIFDFEMRLVRTLGGISQEPGDREAVWDGLDDGGMRVANGAYFYVVDVDGTRVDGKILLIE